MYLHLSKNHIVQISYELGYVLGSLLKQRCVFDLREIPKFRVRYNVDLLRSLEFIGLENKIEIVEEPEGQFIILSYEMFDMIHELNNYIKKQLFHSSTLFESKPCAIGFLDAFKTGLTITFNEKILDFIEKIMWYWFEKKLSIGTYVNQNRQRMHFFKVL
jgi:hypothetical protein